MRTTFCSRGAAAGAFLAILLLVSSLLAAEKPAGDTVVYHMKGKNRVHVAQCRRLPKDDEELAKYTKMTLKEAEDKGLELCSKCPGSSTPGREKNK